jgi:hypothetical protein
MDRVRCGKTRPRLILNLEVFLIAVTVALVDGEKTAIFTDNAGFDVVSAIACFRQVSSSLRQNWRKQVREMFEEIEKIELVDQLFGTDFPVELTQDLTANNSRELVDYFELQLRGWGPNRAAADFLKKLAKNHNNPALAEGLHDNWRRDQISAFIREIFKMGDQSAGGDGAEIPVRKPRGPKAGGGAAAQSLDEDNPSGRS